MNSEKIEPVQSIETISPEEMAKKIIEKNVDAAKDSIDIGAGEELAKNIDTWIEESGDIKLKNALEAAKNIKTKKEELNNQRFEWWKAIIEWTEDLNIDLGKLDLIIMEWELGSTNPDIQNNMRLGKDNIIIIENQDIDEQKWSLYLQKSDDNTIIYKWNSVEQSEEKKAIENELEKRGTSITINKETWELILDPEWRKNSLIRKMDEDGSISLQTEKKFDEETHGRDKELWTKLVENMLLWSLVEDKKELKNREKSKSTASEQYTSNIDKNITLVSTDREWMNKVLDTTKENKKSYEAKITKIQETYKTNLPKKESEAFGNKILASEDKIAELLDSAATIKEAFEKNPANKELTWHISAIIIAVKQENSVLESLLTDTNNLADTVLKSLETRAVANENIEWLEAWTNEWGESETEEWDGTIDDVESNEQARLSDELITNLKTYTQKTSAELRKDSGFVSAIQLSLATLFPDMEADITNEQTTDLYAEWHTKDGVRALQKRMWFTIDAETSATRVDGMAGTGTLTKMLEMHTDGSLYETEDKWQEVMYKKIKKNKNLPNWESISKEPEIDLYSYLDKLNNWFIPETLRTIDFLIDAWIKSWIMEKSDRESIEDLIKSTAKDSNDEDSFLTSLSNNQKLNSLFRIWWLEGSLIQYPLNEIKVKIVSHFTNNHKVETTDIIADFISHEYLDIIPNINKDDISNLVNDVKNSTSWTLKKIPWFNKDMQNEYKNGVKKAKEWIDEYSIRSAIRDTIIELNWSTIWIDSPKINKLIEDSYENSKKGLWFQIEKSIMERALMTWFIEKNYTSFKLDRKLLFLASEITSPIWFLWIKDSWSTFDWDWESILWIYADNQWIWHWNLADKNLIDYKQVALDSLALGLWATVAWPIGWIAVGAYTINKNKKSAVLKNEVATTDFVKRNIRKLSQENDKKNMNLA